MFPSPDRPLPYLSLVGYSKRMWNPFKHGPKLGQPLDAPRNPDGTYIGSKQGTTPAQQVKTVQADSQVMTTTLQTVDTMFSFMDKFNERIDSRVSAALEEGVEPEPDGLMAYMPLISQIISIPAVQGYLPSIFDRLGLKNSNAPLNEGVANGAGDDAHPPATPPQTGSLITYISMAAKAEGKLGQRAIKTALPKLWEEAEKQGIPREDLSKAIQNIAKAI